MRFVLAHGQRGAARAQSQGLIRDRVRAELQTHFANEGRRLLGVASEHAGLVFEIASLVRDGIAAARGGARAAWPAGRAGRGASSTMPTRW